MYGGAGGVGGRINILNDLKHGDIIPLDSNHQILSIDAGSWKYDYRKDDGQLGKVWTANDL